MFLCFNWWKYNILKRKTSIKIINNYSKSNVSTSIQFSSYIYSELHKVQQENRLQIIIWKRKKNGTSHWFGVRIVVFVTIVVMLNKWQRNYYIFIFRLLPYSIIIILSFIFVHFCKLFPITYLSFFCSFKDGYFWQSSKISNSQHIFSLVIFILSMLLLCV